VSLRSPRLFYHINPKFHIERTNPRRSSFLKKNAAATVEADMTRNRTANTEATAMTFTHRTGRGLWGRGATAPLILIGIGAFFLARNFGFAIDIGRWWPLILVVAGLGLLLDRMGNR
jgi:hypothetical protein